MDIQDVEESKIDGAMGKAVAQPGAEKIEDRKRKTGQEHVSDVQKRGNKQKGILDRFGDARQEGGEGRRRHEAARLGPPDRFGRKPDGHGGAYQAEHLEEVPAREDAALLGITRETDVGEPPERLSPPAW